MARQPYTFAQHAQELLNKTENPELFTQWLIDHKAELVDAYQRLIEIPPLEEGPQAFVKWAWILFAIDGYQHLIEVHEGEELDLEHAILNRLLDNPPTEICPEIEYSLDLNLSLWALKDLNTLQQMENQRLLRAMRHIEAENCLCGATGREVIAEFGWFGSLDEVIAQCKSLLDAFEEREWTELDRLDGIERRCRLLRYRYHRRIQIAKQYEAKKYGPGPTIQRWLFERRMHRRKECLCYSNLIL
jgi:hypothetical protein